MSVVATRVYPNRIEIAADSQMTFGMTMQSAMDVKLFTSELGIIVGGVGMMEEISLLKIFLKTHVPAEATEDGITELMHRFRMWTLEHAELSEDWGENQYHFIVDKKAFAIHRYNVREITSFDAIGAGMDYALTALYLDRSPTEACKLACDLNIYCSLPVSTLTRTIAETPV